MMRPALDKSFLKLTFGNVWNIKSLIFFFFFLCHENIFFDQIMPWKYVQQMRYFERFGDAWSNFFFFFGENTLSNLYTWILYHISLPKRRINSLIFSTFQTKYICLSSEKKKKKALLPLHTWGPFKVV